MAQRQLELNKIPDCSFTAKDKNYISVQISPKVSVEIFKKGPNVKMRLRKSGISIMLDFDTFESLCDMKYAILTCKSMIQ